ncbi:hypothetical protein K523DRAFT_252046 [Schizophyllum commune Tattone D]|nr:hypothetical protein K523DRAFT_252046 [Schizophyllum commune Tattone D]
MATTIIMFLMSSACLLLEVLNTMSLLEGILLETRGEVENPSAWNSMQSTNDRAFAQAAIFAFELIISDSVVVWRGVALWGYSWRCSTIMLLPLLGDLVVYVYFLACEGQTKWSYIAGMQDKRCHDLQRAMYFISFLTNLFATSFIIAKAWQHRGAFEVRRPSLTGSGRPRRTAAQKVMLLLIESGFVYLIMGAASGFTYFLVAQDLSSPGYFVTTVFISLRYQIVGLYPTIVIYLVQREQTNWHIPQTGESLYFKDIEKEDTTACTTTGSYTLAVKKYDGVASSDADKIITPTSNCVGDASGCNPVSTRPPQGNQRQSSSSMESNESPEVIAGVAALSVQGDPPV